MMQELNAGVVCVHVDREGGGAVGLTVAQWPGFRLDRLLPSLRVNGEELTPSSSRAVREEPNTVMHLEHAFPGNISLCMHLEPWHGSGVRLRPELCYGGGNAAVLNDVRLLRTGRGGTAAAFGARPESVRVMEQQGTYGGRVRWLAEPPGDPRDAAHGEPNEAPANTSEASDIVWVAYDHAARKALLVGFLSSERWLGRIEMESSPAGQVLDWRVGFDGADVLLQPGTTIPLEEVLFLAGDDPWRLLEDYADTVRAIHNPSFPQKTPVSWCSWYPYRLGVTEERVIENAQVAAERLKPLGLRIMEIDLGWEKGNLPNAFEENERFPHGLKWLSEQMQLLGFELGVWKAPYTISEFDPVAVAHPEYLVQGENGRPAPYWEWFWEPHGKVYILDLTHPGAQQWLRERITTLADRGIRYLKTDFIGCVTHPLAKDRHDKEIAAGCATEAARLGARIIRESLPDALILNCGGPEMPGSGHWPLLYTCSDTGNTGFISHRFQQTNYQSVACHLFKNGRWGVLQPSCLCVGAPGTVEDARLRATIAFLAGGQIDISDTLTTLPEDRWAVLTATLPPLGVTAKPIDLFEPLKAVPFDYEGTCKGESGVSEGSRELPAGSVWMVHVVAPWDEWDLVGVFSYGEGSSAEKPDLSRFVIPFARLGIEDRELRWGYEFWGCQFLGTVPGKRRNPGGYVHPGDYQDLVSGDASGSLDISFFGPGVKLLCLRTVRPHPWVAGTSFHQSCGTELKGVSWDPESCVLSGEVHRPPGGSGFVVIATAGMTPLSQEVDGQPVVGRTGANGALILSVTLTGSPARWSVRFRGAEA